CAALQWWHFFHDINVRKVAIYKVPGHSAIDLIDCGQTYFLTDPVLRHDTTAIRFHIAPHRLLVGVNKVYGNAPFGRVLKGCTLIGWHGRKILVVTEESFHVPEGMMVDWLVIANNALRDAGQVSRRITCGKVILDSSNSFF